MQGSWGEAVLPFCSFFFAPLCIRATPTAQWFAHLSSKQKVHSSNPAVLFDIIPAWFAKCSFYWC